MPTLRIEHSVPDFAMWKRAFDSDPADRKGSGVRSYEVFRSVENPNFVMIDLEFDTQPEAGCCWPPCTGSGVAAPVSGS